MSLITLQNTYMFIGGAIIGKITGLFSTVIISGILLYVSDASIFTVETIKTNWTSITNVINLYRGK